MATARMLDTATASHSLGEVLDLGSVTVRELYATLDWLVSEQVFIETALARRRHLKEGVLCCTTSPPPTGKTAAVRRRGSATAGTIAAAARKWSSVCCA